MNSSTAHDGKYLLPGLMQSRFAALGTGSRSGAALPAWILQECSATPAGKPGERKKMMEIPLKEEIPPSSNPFHAFPENSSTFWGWRCRQLLISVCPMVYSARRRRRQDRCAPQERSNIFQRQLGDDRPQHTSMSPRHECWSSVPEQRAPRVGFVPYLPSFSFWVFPAKYGAPGDPAPHCSCLGVIM